MDSNNTQNSAGKKVGPIIGALIIIILLVVAALYAWGHRLNKEAEPAADQAQAVQASAAAQNTNAAPAADQTGTAAKMSSSDDIDSLSKDLGSVDASSSSSF
ncbi:MAG: hypothetical protein JWO73_377 [Candidatus Taylorbacteria bacterium]|nr:hypothetical protein [Candidatus Taylorbacteria bacterium]